MIRSLRLQNFKCFEDQSIEFGPLTLLSGLNGMGKSSVLQSLLLLRQSHEQDLLQKKGLALNGSLVRLGIASDALFEGAKEEKIGFDLVLKDGREAKWRFGYNRKDTDIPSVQTVMQDEGLHFNYNPVVDVLDLVSPPVDPEIFNSSLFSDNFHYLQAERIGPRTSFEMSDFLVRRHRQLGTRGEYTAHFLSVFSRNKIPNDALIHPKSKSPDLRDQIEAWVGEVSPGIRLHFTSHADMDLVSLKYSLVIGQQVSNPYRSTNVGFGITYTLPILVAILSSAKGALLLLENPEAHLHPKGQAKIGELVAYAANCGVQVVIETHSDHVLNGIRLAIHNGNLHPDSACLHFFQRREQNGQACIEVISPRIDRNGRIDQWPDGFFDEWDKSLEALLEPGGT